MYYLILFSFFFLATKINLDNCNDITSDILGISAVIINDLKQRRHRDYIFDWNKALQMNGDTGIKLQYTHCRLYNLEKNLNSANIIIPNQNNNRIKSNYLLELESINLIYELSKYNEILIKTYETLESCILVNYLFNLTNSISRALKVLNIKNEICSIKREQRYQLFNKSRHVLYDGMKILGLKPLNKM